MLPVRSGNQLSYQQQLAKLKIGLINAQGNISAVPVSLTPWCLSTRLWQQAQEYSQLLSRLLWAASRDRSWLAAQFPPVASETLLTTLAALPDAFSQTSQATPIMRHDFLLDRFGQWRWVESNTIAAGMGPLNQQLVLLLSADYDNLAPNPAIIEHATALYRAALTMQERYDNAAPVIVFVVAAKEDNLFDQMLLQWELERLGALVIRSSLQQLTHAQVNHRNRLQLASGDEVDLLYYRTGYNQADYDSKAQLMLRGRLQRTALIQCPDLPLQLAGSKWIQASISQLLLADTTDRLQSWGFSVTELAQLRSLIVPVYTLAQMTPVLIENCLNCGWILKSQQEGGGSVWRGAEAKLRLKSDTDQLLLMAPIDVHVRTEPVSTLRDAIIQQHSATVSELGIFTTGDQHRYGGYLLRSKPATELAGGVHRGAAVLDTVQLKETSLQFPTYNPIQIRYDDEVSI
jgi:glutathione synthase